MVFPYWKVRRGLEVRHLPIVMVGVIGPRGMLNVPGLVDSGSEHSVLGANIAADLGISLVNEAPVTLIGIGGKKIPGNLVPLEMQLGRYRWATTAIFSEAVDQRIILGQLGFFAFFNVAFRYRRREIEITRVRLD